MKAQIKMTESIAILVVFFFLLMLGMVFYTKMQGSSMEKKKEEIYIKKAIQVGQTTAFLPELLCSSGTEEDVIVSTACIDLYKLKAIAEKSPQDSDAVITKNKLDFYYDIFYFSEIKLYVVYPPAPINAPWDESNPLIIYSNTPDKFTRKYRNYFPVLLEDSFANQPALTYYFAVLVVDYYTR